jgi:hypothetical protein
MRWLPRLLSHAAAAGKIPATSHGFATGGRRRGGVPGASAVSDAVVPSEEPKKKRRRDAAAKSPRRRRTASVSLIGGLADAARAFVRAWQTARKQAAPSTSCRHGELDLARVQASGFSH